MIPDVARQALSSRLVDRIEFDVPMARHTSLRIGGPADALATPSDVDELADLLSICAAHDIAITMLGSGFNVLVCDTGLEGVVVRLKKLRRIERRGDREIFVEAGASHATITRYCVENGLSGLEFAAGIPGTLGGWLAMNAGIGVREMKDVVRSIELLSANGAERIHIERADLDFQYRCLAGLAPGSVLVSACLEVTPSERPIVQSEIDGLLAHRQATQPTDIPSCGSVFRNPPQDFAGRLVEAAGMKGETAGGAQISTLHANFIVNRGGATAADVLQLIERARAAVFESSGVRLEPEVKILGVEKGTA